MWSSVSACNVSQALISLDSYLQVLKVVLLHILRDVVDLEKEQRRLSEQVCDIFHIMNNVIINDQCIVSDEIWV